MGVSSSPTQVIANFYCFLHAQRGGIEKCQANTRTRSVIWIFFWADTQKHPQQQPQELATAARLLLFWVDSNLLKIKCWGANTNKQFRSNMLELEFVSGRKCEYLFIRQYTHIHTQKLLICMPNVYSQLFKDLKKYSYILWILNLSLIQVYSWHE